MMERMPAREYLTWAAFFKLKPAGDRLTASMLYNVNRSKSAAFMEPDDFMNAISQKQKQESHQQLSESQSPKEIRSMLEAASKQGRQKKKR